MKSEIYEIRKRGERERDQIIDHKEGHAIVIAGPRSGKTTTLTEGLVKLCTESDLDRIGATAFTNNAADEMKEHVNVFLFLQ